MLLSGVRGQLSLLFVWTLLQVAGPGMLYPCGVSALQQWWKEKLGRVQARGGSACLAVTRELGGGRVRWVQG